MFDRVRDAVTPSGLAEIGNAMVTQQMGGVVDDKLNVPLEDAELLAEVELTTNLIIAASESDVSLSQEEVDTLLGLSAVNGSQIPAQQRHPD
jgi:hypothetical protein